MLERTVSALELLYKFLIYVNSLIMEFPHFILIGNIIDRGALLVRYSPCKYLAQRLWRLFIRCELAKTY